MEPPWNYRISLTIVFQTAYLWLIVTSSPLLQQGLQLEEPASTPLILEANNSLSISEGKIESANSNNLTTTLHNTSKDNVDTIVKNCEFEIFQIDNADLIFYNNDSDSKTFSYTIKVGITNYPEKWNLSEIKSFFSRKASSKSDASSEHDILRGQKLNWKIAVDKPDTIEVPPMTKFVLRQTVGKCGEHFEIRMSKVIPMGYAILTSEEEEDDPTDFSGEVAYDDSVNDGLVRDEPSYVSDEIENRELDCATWDIGCDQDGPKPTNENRAYSLRTGPIKPNSMSLYNSASMSMSISFPQTYLVFATFSIVTVLTIN